MNIVTIIPTRGRPDAVRDIVEFWDVTKPKSDVFLAVDDDDPYMNDYRNLADHLVTGVHFGKEKRLRMNGTLNYWAKSLAHVYDVVGFMGDDHHPRGDWESKLFAAFEADDDLKVVYGNDLIWGEGLPTACWQSSKIVKILGYFSPPKQTHLYLDNYWMALGNATKRVYIPDMIIEHMHPSAGKATWDAQYLEVNDQSMYDADKHAFDEYMANEFESEMEKLRG